MILIAERIEHDNIFKNEIEDEMKGG